MATLRLEPPEHFDVTSPDDWPRWKKTLPTIRLALHQGRRRTPDKHPFVLPGEDADDILASTNITTEERGKYDTVLQKFDDHFLVRRNIIFERARFNKRSQKANQPNSTSLYCISLTAKI